MDGYSSARKEAEQRANANFGTANAQTQNWLQNHMNALATANAAQQNASSGYNTLQQQGTQRYADATSGINNALAGFNAAGGVPVSYGGANPYAAQAPAVQPQGANRTTPGTAPKSAAGTLNRNQAGASQQNSVKDPYAAAQSAANFDPYQLTDPQQMQLNSQVDRLNAAKQTAIQNIQAKYAQSGITDPRALQAAVQHIEEQHGSAAEQAKSGFLEQQRANKQKTYADTLNVLTGQQNAGSQQQLQGIQGGEQQIGNAMNIGADPALQSLIGMLNQNAQHDVGTANSLIGAGNPFNGFANAAGSALGTYLTGGFSNPLMELLKQIKPQTTSTTTSAGQMQTVDPNWNWQNNYALD